MEGGRCNRLPVPNAVSVLQVEKATFPLGYLLEMLGPRAAAISILLHADVHLTYFRRATSLVSYRWLTYNAQNDYGNALRIFSRYLAGNCMWTVRSRAQMADKWFLFLFLGWQHYWNRLERIESPPYPKKTLVVPTLIGKKLLPAIYALNCFSSAQSFPF